MSMESALKKMNDYSTLGAKQMKERGKHATFYAGVLPWLLVFLQVLFY